MFGISVIVCTFNGKERLGPTLNSILSQKKTEKFLWELILVDNASFDNTKEWVLQVFSSRIVSVSWKIVIEPQKGLSHARMCGLREAKYDWILFCDDDNHLFEDYLFQATHILKDNYSIGALGGCGLPLFESDKPIWWDRYSHSFAVGSQSDKDGKIIGDFNELYGAGSFFRRDPLLRLFNSGFKPIMTDRIGKSLVSGGDVEWCYLLQVLGFEIWYNSKLRFYHYMPSERLTWDYYLKLKKGISLGYANLIPYRLFLTFKFRKYNYYFKYVTQFLHQLFMYTFFYFKVRFTNIYDDEAKSLGAVVIPAKLNSFAKGFISTYKIHTRLKDIAANKLNNPLF